MKKIKYSVSEHTVKWGAKAGEKRYTANLQTTGIMSLDDFAGHMADHDCKYNKGDIYSVLTQAANCVREMLLEGNKVSLGDLGVISPKIKQRAAKSRDEFSSSNITDLYAKITIGKALKDMRRDASFENVPTLANQALLIAAEREGADTVSLVKPTGNGETSNEGGGSSNGSGGSSENQGQNGSGNSGSQTPSTPTLTISMSGTGSSTVKVSGNNVSSGSQIAAGTQVDIEVTPAEGQTPTALLNGSSITLTESDGTYTGTFEMPDGNATLVINSGGSTGGGVDQN